MNINEFITTYGIRPADAIVLNKRIFGMVDHYVIYLGLIDFQHKFVANYVPGVKIIPNQEIEHFLTNYAPSKVEKYPGREHQRPEAVKRAMSRIGEKAYSYVANNCEHFKNFVHYGIHESTQVQKLGGIVALGGLGISLIGAGKKNSTAIGWGIVIILIGIIIALLGSTNKKETGKKYV